ncbi:general secretion pathway protein F [alpha proteobacterium U9-1i]|nr:general secretion pathway protein F [alpha proteobacterium U9-1i]
MNERRFTYRALDAGGRTTTNVVSAPNRAEALRRLRGENKVVIEVSEAAETQRTSAIKADDRIQVLRQLGVMARAGVELLEALDTIASAMKDRPIAAHLRAAAGQLRQGQRLARAFEIAAPFYPAYVYALMRAGESSGKLAIVLEEAVRQLSYEERSKRDIQNALAYPAFLVVAGAVSIGFLFYAVVPRFGDMLRNARAELTGLSAFVIGAGEFFRDNALLVMLGFAALIAAVAGAFTTESGARAAGDMARAIPGLKQLLEARRRANWARIMAITLDSGVSVLDASALAAASLHQAPTESAAAIQALRGGKRVDETFSKSGLLTPVDASMIRAGQRSGALGEMFRAVADRNEEDFRDALKRLTLLVEPIAIALVASAIGVIVLSLVSALASIYESIG